MRPMLLEDVLSLGTDEACVDMNGGFHRRTPAPFRLGPLDAHSPKQ